MKLRIEDLERLRAYRFVPRRRVEGVHAGRHPSPQRGQSVEFRDYRPYIPGDEVAAVDWKVFGRSDKLYVKVFEHETELTVTLLLDNSRSMAYAGRGEETKRDHGARLAAAIAFLLVNQQDRFAFALAENGAQGFLPPSRQVSSLTNMLEQVNRRRPAGHAALAKAIGTVSSRMRRGEILIVISDLWEDRGHILDACSRILFRGGEVVLMQLLHDDELNLPPENAAILVDSEQLRSQVHVDLDAVRADYRREVAKHLAQWRADCLQARLDYQLCSASRPYYESLAGYLARRSAAG